MNLRRRGSRSEHPRSRMWIDNSLSPSSQLFGNFQVDSVPSNRSQALFSVISPTDQRLLASRSRLNAMGRQIDQSGRPRSRKISVSALSPNTPLLEINNSEGRPDAGRETATSACHGARRPKVNFKSLLLRMPDLVHTPPDCLEIEIKEITDVVPHIGRNSVSVRSLPHAEGDFEASAGPRHGSASEENKQVEGRVTAVRVAEAGFTASNNSGWSLTTVTTESEREKS